MDTRPGWVGDTGTERHLHLHGVLEMLGILFLCNFSLPDPLQSSRQMRGLGLMTRAYLTSVFCCIGKQGGNAKDTIPK